SPLQESWASGISNSPMRSPSGSSSVMPEPPAKRPSQAPATSEPNTMQEGAGSNLSCPGVGKSSPTKDQPMKPPPTANANTTAPNTNPRLGREPRRSVLPVGASEGAGSGTPASGTTGPRRP